MEVIKARTLERLLQGDDVSLEDREHVTTVMYRHEDSITVDRLVPADLQSEVSGASTRYAPLTIDTAEDAARFTRVLQMAGVSRVWPQGWQRCLELVRLAEQGAFVRAMENRD